MIEEKELEQLYKFYVHLQKYQSITTKLFTQKLQPKHNILETHRSKRASKHARIINANNNKRKKDNFTYSLSHLFNFKKLIIWLQLSRL